MAIAIEYSWFLNEKLLGSSGLRHRFARERVRRIRNILGGALADKVIDKVLQRYGAEQDPKNWHSFRYASGKGEDVSMPF
jgi:hypothetical protein